MIERFILTQDPVKNWESFQADFPPDRYRGFTDVEYENRRLGGYWQGKVKLHAPPLELADLFRNSLGRQAYLLNGRGFTAFHGEVDELHLTLESGGKVHLNRQRIYNRVWVRMKDLAGSFSKTAVSSDSDSIAKYGTFDLPISGGRVPSTSNAELVASRILRQRAFPKRMGEGLTAASDYDRHDKPVMLEFVLSGYIRRLRRRVYNQTASTETQSLDLGLADIVAAVGEYVAGTRFKPNTIAMQRDFDSDQWALDIMFGAVAQGDTLGYPWTLYMDASRYLVLEPWSPPEDVER